MISLFSSVGLDIECLDGDLCKSPNMVARLATDIDVLLLVVEVSSELCCCCEIIDDLSSSIFSVDLYSITQKTKTKQHVVIAGYHR